MVGSIKLYCRFYIDIAVQLSQVLVGGYTSRLRKFGIWNLRRECHRWKSFPVCSEVFVFRLLLGHSQHFDFVSFQHLSATGYLRIVLSVSFLPFPWKEDFSVAIHDFFFDLSVFPSKKKLRQTIILNPTDTMREGTCLSALQLSTCTNNRSEFAVGMLSSLVLSGNVSSME